MQIGPVGMSRVSTVERPPPGRDVLQEAMDRRAAMAQAPKTKPGARSPLQLVDEGLPLEWIGKHLAEEFKRQNGLRQQKLERHDFAARVINQLECWEAGHNMVNPRFQHRDPLAEAALLTWSAKVTGRLFPDNVPWLDIEIDGTDAEPEEPPEPTPEQLQDPGYAEARAEEEREAALTKEDIEAKGYIAEAVEKVMWAKLMERSGELFDAWALRANYTGACGFGCLAIVSHDQAYGYRGQRDDAPCYDLYDFPEYVLDEGSRKSWEESFCIVRQSFDRGTIQRLAKPDGLRGEVFDAKQVERVFGQNREGHREELPSETSATQQQENDGTVSAPTPDRYDAFQYRGPLYHEGKLVSENALITCINGVCIQAIHSPVQYRTWQIIGSRFPRAGSVYCESIGYSVALLVNKINLAETLSMPAAATAMMGMLQFKDAAQFEKWHGGTVFGPGEIVAPGLEKLDFTWTPELVDHTYARNKKAIEELTGISEMDLANPGAASVTAQAAGNAQAGASSRQAADAKLLTGPFLGLLNIILWTLIDNWVDQEVWVRGHKVMVRREHLEGFDGRCQIKSIGTSVVAPFQQAQKMQNVGILRQDPTANQSAVTRYAVEGQMPKATLDEIYEPPPAPPAPVAQPGQMPGQGSNVIPMPQAAGMVQQ